MSEADSTLDVILNETVEGILNETAQNATKISTPEGMCLAYGSLFAMAIIPIWIGSFRSVRFLQNSRKNGDKPEAISNRDAMMFPVIASCVLLGIYIVLKILRKDLVNLLLAIYFCGLGIMAITHTVAPFLSRFWPRNAVRYSLTVVHYKPHANADKQAEGAGTTDAQKQTGHEKLTIELIKHQPQADGEVDGSSQSQNRGTVYLAVNFTHYDLIVFAASCVVCAWYSVQKHWIANNMIGLAFAVNAIELLQLNTIITGIILLGGLFFYDVFWVFGTDVMVSVAKSFDAPIKLVFPQDILEKGLFDASNFAMLGLGDIVIPGIFIALLLRFDVSLHEQSEKESQTSNKKRTNTKSDTSSPARQTYFLAGYIAYIAGLATTILVMHWFKHAQPALLYLVPSCLGLPLAVALVKGDWGRIFSYADAPAEPAAADSSSASTKKSE